MVRVRLRDSWIVEEDTQHVLEKMAYRWNVGTILNLFTLDGNGGGAE